ncbi:hypothetical protein JTB14_019529 [Gonioctena quinquepunctata]|nr:hypothetical protein JTB14_019529 [Gonioctena quinquepunctata]
METTVILSRTYSSRIVPFKTNFRSPRLKLRHKTNMNLSFTKFGAPKHNFTHLADVNITYWNQSDFFHNTTNSSEFEYDYQVLNVTASEDESWSTCKEWTPAQHTLFQAANFFFAAAFLVPGSFKQSVLLVR